MSYQTLIALAELHHSFGLIGISEFVERCEVARWLQDPTPGLADPRDPEAGDPDREEEVGEAPEGQAVTVRTGDPSDPDDPGYLQFLFMKWVFTKADPDPYPSTPHGHWQNQNRKWPKLNPYTGRAYSAKEQEDKSQRLSRSQLRMLWGDEAFRDFCRGHLVWYREKFRFHRFPVPDADLLRFPWW